MNALNRVRVFEVTYVPCTNFRGSRVKIRDTWFNETKIIQYDYIHNQMADMAQAYLEKIGFNVVADSADQDKHKHFLMVDTWGKSFKEMIAEYKV